MRRLRDNSLIENCRAVECLKVFDTSDALMSQMSQGGQGLSEQSGSPFIESGVKGPICSGRNKAR